MTDSTDDQKPSIPRCVVCRRTLTGQGQTCSECTATTAQLLTDISRWHTDAVNGLGRRVSGAIAGGGSRGGSDGLPLPGGDLLVLTGPGSPGLSETGLTDKPGDPRPIVYELCWWEQEWRGRFSEPSGDLPLDLRAERYRHDLHRLLHKTRTDARAAAQASRTALAAAAARTAREISSALNTRQTSRAVLDSQVSRACEYLRSRHTRAARSHPGFAQYAADLRMLHTQLARATGHLRTPRRLPADCLDCGPGNPLWILIHETTGLEEPWATCPSCQRRYNEQAHRLARAMTVRRGSTWTDPDGEEWATPETTATMLDRPMRTIRDWARRDLIRSTLLGGRLFVATGDAAAEHEQRQERERARERRTG